MSGSTLLRSQPIYSEATVFVLACVPQREGAPRRTRRRDDLKEKRSSRTEATEVVDRTESFAAAFFGLKRIFAPYTKSLNVNADTRTRLYLETKSASYKGKPLFFGAVISGRAYVSFHLMPLYWDGSLTKKLSANLKNKMQGKSCFNFTAPEPKLFRELAKVTAAGFALYKRKNLL